MIIIIKITSIIVIIITYIYIETNKKLHMGGRICRITAGPTILHMGVGLEGRNLVMTTRPTQLICI